MNLEKLVLDVKKIFHEATGYAEYNPRISRDVSNEAFPNTGVFRVVMVGTGQARIAGAGRYVDFIGVLVTPLSGGDANQSNLDTAVEAENMITELSDYAGDDTSVSEEINNTISRESGRMVSSFEFRISYKLT